MTTTNTTEHLENDVKDIYIVTHGDKFSGADPMMTSMGIIQIEALRDCVPANVTQVVCGTGRRHSNVAYVLRREPTRYTTVVGGPESLDKIDGKQMVVLADGRHIPLEIYTATSDLAPAMVALVVSLPHNSLICAGRPSMIQLGKKDAKSAAVYKVECRGGKISQVIEVAVANLKIVP